MEKSVFIQPEVSGKLQKTIEARLHTDAMTSPLLPRMKELQKKLAGVPTLPVYIMLDPKTGKQLARMDGARGEKPFLEFLEQAGL